MAYPELLEVTVPIPSTMEAETFLCSTIITRANVVQV